MKSLVLLLVFIIPCLLFAESEKTFVRKGNKQFKDGKYNEAEINYRKSLEKKPNYSKGTYNLGDALYKQKNYQEAAEKFLSIGQDPKVDKETRAMAYHNLGNSLLEGKQYAPSIEAYKNSLKLSPKDEQTRYNLEYAKKMLIQQQQQQQQKQNKNQNQDKIKPYKSYIFI